MGKIFCLMGKSCSGKDTLFKILIRDPALNLKPIIPYTTRPKRINETDGVEYYFIDEGTLNNFIRLGKIIEKREYETVDGKWCYCTLNDGQVDLERNNYLIIVTLEAYKNLQNYFGEDNVIPIYINLEDGVRLQRALNRELKQNSRNYDELCRRFLADNTDFSLEKLKIYKINYCYDNYDLKECIKNIRKLIYTCNGNNFPKEASINCP